MHFNPQNLVSEQTERAAWASKLQARVGMSERLRYHKFCLASWGLISTFNGSIGAHYNKRSHVFILLV